MKKLLSVLLTVLLLAAALSLSVFAEEDGSAQSIRSFLSDAASAVVNAGQDALPADTGETPAPETEIQEEDPPADGDIDDNPPFYVIDLADILTDEEETALTEAALAVSQTYGCSVHIGTIPDMRDYGFSSIKDCAEEFFNSFGLGLGDDHTGILLLLSMAERDYDIDAHGSFAHYALTDYGKTTISDVFLDNFRNNDWYGGFYDYIGRCGAMLERAQNGEPVDVGHIPASPAQTGIGLVMSGVLAILIAWGVCSLLKGKNKSVHTASDADRYLPAGAVHFRIRDDRFVNQTVTRVKIERNHSGGGGGGTTISSGGHSHSSGKF